MQFSRTQVLLGEDAMRRLHGARVAVFGLGGVGGYVAEALARSGVGALDLIDHDRVSITNINRQIFATHSTVGFPKVEVARRRLLDISPQLQLRVYPVFFTPETADTFDFSAYDYIVDAIDTVTAKLCLAERAFAAGTPIISCMGAGNKLDASAFRVADISKTSVCPLARVMRKELKKRGISHMKVVFSTEEAHSCAALHDEAVAQGKRQIPGSICYAPAIAGLLLAAEVLRDLTATPSVAAANE